MCGM
jgi:GTP-binding nuclear protein Ran